MSRVDDVSTAQCLLQYILIIKTIKGESLNDIKGAIKLKR